MLSFLIATTLAPSLREQMDFAIADERHAAAFYGAVMEVHGSVRPFANIIRAERQHEQLLVGLYETRSWPIPKDSWARQEKETVGEWVKRMKAPADFRTAASAAWKAEVENVALYDKWLAGELPADVKSVFTKLRDDSRDRHMPAFARWKDR